jgi:hypothetical protein
MFILKDPPKWLYKPIHIDNLKEIQKEILPIILRHIPNFVAAAPYFYQLFPNDIAPYAPNYVKCLKDIGVYENWLNCAVITTNRGIPVPIHVDDRNWKKQ